MKLWIKGAYVEPYIHNNGRGGCNPLEVRYIRLGGVYKNPAGGCVVIVGGKQVQVKNLSEGKKIVEERRWLSCE